MEICKSDLAKSAHVQQSETGNKAYCILSVFSIQFFTSAFASFMSKWCVWFKIQAGNHTKKLLKLFLSVKTNFSFPGLKFLDPRLHTLRLNICR